MGKDRNLEHGEPPCTKDNPDYCKVSEDTARAIFGSKQQIQMLRAVKAVAKQIKDDDAVEKLEESIKLLESLEWTYIRLDHLQWDVREDRQLEKATKKIAEQEADGHPDVIRELMRAIHEGQGGNAYDADGNRKGGRPDPRDFDDKFGPGSVA